MMHAIPTSCIGLQTNCMVVVLPVAPVVIMRLSRLPDSHVYDLWP